MGTIPVTDPHKAWNVKQFKRLEAYNARLQKLLDNAIKKAAAIAMLHDAKASDEHLFSFSDDRQMKAEADKLMKDLSDEITSFTKSAIGKEWEKALQQATEYIGMIYSLAKQTQERKDAFLDMMLGMRSRNEDALIEFNKRKIGGLNLSKKVWSYTQDFERQLEVSIDTALMQGMSANNLALSIQSLLKDPDDLFRRVRDENDQLRMSKAMAAYHPGTGKYRSAYKNAMRLARSEINMAYRSSDCNVAMMSDCCVGIEIHLSNNHNCKGVPKGEFYDICDQLAGKYPKDFQWTGWHPQCRCFMTYVLKTDDEFWTDLENGENNESVNTVKDVPDNFKEWVKDNEERIKRSEQKGKLPYFVKDNGKYIKENSALKQRLGETLGNSKLGREATKEALELYGRDGASKPNNYSELQINNHREIENALGIKQGKDMSFVEADGGNGNVDYGKGNAFSDNCQCCVVANELRRRGFDVTALGHYDDKESIPFKLGDDLTLAFVNKKGNKPQMTMIKNVSESSLEKATSAAGRYIVGYDTIDGSGHVICAKRLTTGDLVFFDPQIGKAIKLNYEELASLEVLKTDGMMFNTEIIKSIVRVHE